METVSSYQTLARMAWQVGIPADQLVNFHKGYYVPLPWALSVHAACREADQPGGPDEIGIGGSRGPGKSHLIFSQLALDDCQRRDGLKCLYLRKIGKGAREQLDDLRRRILAGVPHRFNRAEGVIYFPNGSRIVIGHFKDEKDVDNYLGLEYDVIAIEETTTLTLLKYRALRDSNRTSRSDWRPRIYNSTNPGGVGHAWYKNKFITPFRRGLETTTRFFPGTVDDNPLIDADYTRRLEENTGWRLRAYRYGDWEIAAGQFFSTWRHEVHVIEPFKVIPSDWPVWLSLDYGFVHPTSIHLHVKGGDGMIYTIDEHWLQRAQVRDHAGAMRDMLARWQIDPRRLVSIPAGSDCFVQKDPGTPTIARQYETEGFTLTPAMTDRVNGAANMLRLLGDPERGLAPRWKVFTTCPRLIECLPAMEHDPNRPEDVLKVDIDDDGQGGDDPYDDVRYGLNEIERTGQGLETGGSPFGSYRG